MKSILTLTCMSLLLSAIVFSQESSREHKIQSLVDLSAKMRAIEDELLQPTEEDIRKASARGLTAVRLIPLGKFAEHTFDRGGRGLLFLFDKLPQL